MMRAHFGLPSVTAEDTEGKPPIQVKFEIPYFTTSGIQVYLLNWNYAVVANINVITVKLASGLMFYTFNL